VIKAQFEEKDNQIAFLTEQLHEIKSEIGFLEILRVTKQFVVKSGNGMVDEKHSILDDRRRFSIQYVDKADNQTRTIKFPIDTTTRILETNRRIEELEELKRKKLEFLLSKH
jgi:hypothetical protein